MSLFHLISNECQTLLREGGLVLWGILVVGAWVYTMIFSTWCGLQRFECKLDNECVSDSGEKRSIVREFAVFELDRLAWVERRTPVIGVMIGICTLGGLLGTVSGMLVTFSNMATLSAASPMEKIATGISEALVTTQAGLLMALPAAFLYALLLRRVAIVRSKTEGMMHAVIRESALGGGTQ
jgi:biopolymer transport protein ExbB